MATFHATLDETFRSPVAPDALRAHFLDPEAIVAATDLVERSEARSEGRIHFVLAKQQHGPYSFQPEYTVWYRREADHVVWSTDEGSMRSEGKAVFHADGAGTRLHFRQTISFELPVPRLAMRMLKPVVAKMAQPGLRTYVCKMLSSANPTS